MNLGRSPFWYDAFWNSEALNHKGLTLFQYIFNKMQRYTVYLYQKTALHVSGSISTHHQEHTQLYLQYLVHVKRLLLPAARQSSSNSSTIATGSTNGLTCTRYCRYSCVLLMMGGDTA